MLFHSPRRPTNRGSKSNIANPLSVFGALALLAVNLAHAQKSISLEGMSPCKIAVFDNHDRLVVSDFSEKRIYLFNSITHELAKTIPVNNAYTGELIVNHRLGLAYLTHTPPGGTNIAVIDVAKDSLLTIISVGLGFKKFIAADTVLENLYAIDWFDPVLHVISMKTNSVTASINLKTYANRIYSDIAVNQKTNEVFITSSSLDSILVFNPLNSAIRWIAAPAAYHIASNDKENKLYTTTTTFSYWGFDVGHSSEIILGCGTDAQKLIYHERMNRVYTNSEIEGRYSYFDGASNSCDGAKMIAGASHSTNPMNGNVHFLNYRSLVTVNESNTMFKIFQFESPQNHSLNRNSISYSKKQGMVFAANSQVSTNAISIFPDTLPLISSIPSILRPGNGNTVSRDSSLIWNKVPGAKYYRLQITALNFDSAQSNPGQANLILVDSVLTDTAYRLAKINPSRFIIGNKYYWRIYSVSQDGFVTLPKSDWERNIRFGKIQAPLIVGFGWGITRTFILPIASGIQKENPATTGTRKSGTKYSANGREVNGLRNGLDANGFSEKFDD